MIFRWLKQYMPHGLYGRAALILILPVVTLQLVVSIVFIQRHFTDVTEQMTLNLSRELTLIIGAPDQRELAAALEFRLSEADVVPVATRLWYDFSGLVVRRVLSDQIDGTEAVVLGRGHTVGVVVDQGNGLIRVDFDRKRVSASNPHQLLVNMVFFGVAMTAVAFVYLRNQLRPITRLAQAAQAFGRGRNLPYNPSGALEVRAAGHAFLDMRARIERHIEQRTMMLSGVSHDLRTPLTRMRLALSMLEDDERLPLEQDVEEMQRLIDEFLSFARGAHEGEAVPIDPVQLVQKVVEHAQRGGQRVSLVGSEGEGLVALRENAMRRAVENLVTNAVRYAGRAELSVRLSDKSLRIRVEDDGPGIPVDQRDEAVKPFARLDPARNQNRGAGVGLGLSIANDVARSHGGVLRLGQSKRLGGLQADIVVAR